MILFLTGIFGFSLIALRPWPNSLKYCLGVQVWKYR
jgi:hypothetical protein